jgi:hypothetical protein
MEKPTIKTHCEGWDCFPAMRELVYATEMYKDTAYEIKHCVRRRSVAEILREFEHIADTIMEQIADIRNQAMDDVTFETVPDFIEVDEEYAP